MFIIRYFKYGFKFKNIFDHQEKSAKIIIFFILISLISIFPSNYKIVKEQGYRLDFIKESFIKSTPTFALPNDLEITGGKYLDKRKEADVLSHEDILIVFNAKYYEEKITQKTLLFYENKIVYNNGKNNEMTAYNYKGFVENFYGRELNLMSGEERSNYYILFGEQIENSFSSYIVYYSLLVNTLITLLTYVLYILLLGLIVQLFRFGFSKFMTYKETLHFLTFVMVIPSLLNFGIGLFEPAFGQVFFQLASGLITMVLMLTVGKRKFQ